VNHADNRSRNAKKITQLDNDTAKTGNSGALQFVTLLRWPE
jgi:hypothetical protein